MPAYLDVTQSEPRAAYQPHEYVFCDPNGGAWSCAVVSRKTPVTLISHPSGISHEKDNDAGAPSGVGQGVPAVSRPNVIQSKPGRPGEGQEVFDEADELGKPMPEHEGPVPEAQRAARARRAELIVGPEHRGVVLFSFDSDRLENHAKAVLISLLDSLRGERIVIRGYTDDIGGEDYNNDLALRRALAVRDFLVNAGFPEGWAQASGDGLCCYVAPNTDGEGRRRNRRVEIHLTNETAQPSAAHNLSSPGV